MCVFGGCFVLLFFLLLLLLFFFIVVDTERLYGNAEFVEERHRHRYEVNPQYIEALEAEGMSFVGHDVDGTRMEIMELPGKKKRRRKRRRKKRKKKKKEKKRII